MNAIEIVLTGVVYLLGPGASPRVEVIIPNAAEPSAPFGAVIPDHYAYLKVRTEDVDELVKNSTPRFPDFVYLQHGDDDNSEIAIYALHGDQIAITGKTADSLQPNPLEVCDEELCGRKMAIMEENEPFEKVGYYRHIPSIDDICHDLCGPLNDFYRTSKNADLVAARMTINRGVISAANLDHSISRFEPAKHKVSNPQHPYHEKELADQAVVQVESDDPVTLTVTPFNEVNPPVNTLTLTLKPGAHIEIGNMMPNDVLPMEAHHPREVVDFHFGLFYKMLLPPVPLDPLIPHRLKLPEQHPGGPRQNCVPIRQDG
jgi:hypothetical protein